MTKRIAFVATSYIKNYDGISVYTENLLLEFLKKIQNQDIIVDIYTGSSVLELLVGRISAENLLNKNINVKAVNDKNNIYIINHNMMFMGDRNKFISEYIKLYSNE